MKSRMMVALVCALAVLGTLATPSGAGGPVVVIVTHRSETGPAVSDQWIAWQEQRQTARRFLSNVFVAPLSDTTQRTRVNPRGTLAFTGGIDGDTLAYELDSDTGADIVFYDIQNDMQTDPPAGVNTERFAEYQPRLSAGYLLFLRLHRDHQDLILYDRDADRFSTIDTFRNGTRRRVRIVVPDQVNDDYAVWNDIVLNARTGAVTGGDVFLYEIASDDVTRLPHRPRQWQYGPSVDDEGTVYFGRSNLACGQTARLMQRTLDGTTTVVYDLSRGRDFQFSYAVDQGATTDVYLDEGDCRGGDYGDIYSIPGLLRMP
jgi:hypothetical protein